MRGVRGGTELRSARGRWLLRKWETLGMVWQSEAWHEQLVL
jgi:hypothetical protein